MLDEELSSAKEKAREKQEREEEEERAAHVRPWDRGKSESRGRRMEGGREEEEREGDRNR